MRISHFAGIMALIFAGVDYMAAKEFRSASGTTRYSRYAKAFAAGYTVSGITSYRLRFSDSNVYTSDPSVCYTTASGYFDNRTFARNLGYFVCPYNSNEYLPQKYCCGADGNQYCCGFWDDGRRLAGAVVGIILPVIIPTFIIVTLCFFRKYYRKKHTETANNQPDPENKKLPRPEISEDC